MKTINYSEKWSGLSGARMDAMSLEAEAIERKDDTAAMTAARLGDRIRELEDFITEDCGIDLPPSKWDK